MDRFEAVVLGASAGGVSALRDILTKLGEHFLLPLIVAQHIAEHPRSALVEVFQDCTSRPVMEIEDKMPIEMGKVYIAPANYHVLVESDRIFSLSVDDPFNYSRPSIDVLFESAAKVFRRHLVGVLLTGASRDGARGLAEIKRLGGFTLVQDPLSAAERTMPAAAIELCPPDHILSLPQIGFFLENSLGADGGRA